MESATGEAMIIAAGNRHKFKVEQESRVRAKQAGQTGYWVASVIRVRTTSDMMREDHWGKGLEGYPGREHTLATHHPYPSMHLFVRLASLCALHATCMH